METNGILRELDRFDAARPIEEASMPPASWYANPAFFELERRSVFGRCWQPVARVAEVTEPGRYVSGCLAGKPYVVARTAEGELRAFHNVCRHKGREVVQGNGRADELVCGYHAWTFGLDGELLRAPGIAGIKDFDREQTALIPMAVDTWGPWVFVNPDSDAPPLRSRLPELDERFVSSGWDRLTFVDRRSWTLECNWKVYVDNFLDGGYHIPHMHPSLDAQIDMETYRTEVFEMSSLQTVHPAREADERIDFDADARIGPGALYAWIYPNFMLNRYGPCLDSNHVVPLGPDRCRVDYEFYFLEVDGREARSFIERSIEQSGVTQREDIAICESVQVGLRSGAYRPGRYAPRIELGEHHFHRLLAEDLRRAASGGASG